jgi:hypothetical protein
MRLIVILNRLTMGIVSLFVLFSILDYDDDNFHIKMLPQQDLMVIMTTQIGALHLIQVIRPYSQVRIE